MNNSNQSGLYHGLICRIIPGPRGTPAQPPRVEILIQKKSHNNAYGLITGQGNAKLKEPQIKRLISSSFNKQCGHVFEGVNQLESPPLISLKQPSGFGGSFLFLINQVHNTWKPRPGNKQNFINYATENIQLGENQYFVENGHVWVNIVDFHLECCQNQRGILDAYIAQMVQKSYNSICQLISAKVKMMYQRTFTTATDPQVIIWQDTQFQIKCSIDYTQKLIRLTLTNITSEVIKITLFEVQCNNNPFFEIVSSGLNLNEVKNITTDFNFDLAFNIKGYFAYEHLPVLSFMYLTGHSVHRCKIRIPVFLYRFCEEIPDLSGKDPQIVKSKMIEQWNNLPSQMNFSVTCTPEDANKLIKGLTDIKVPLYPKFDDFYPVIASLGGKLCLQLLQIVKENNNYTLNVQSKYSEEQLFKSLSEVIFGLASSGAGLEVSLLDIPPFP